MKLGSFVMGGLFGAAATIYLSRNNNAMLNTMMGKATNKLTDLDASVFLGKSKNDSSKHNDHAQIEKIIKEDPQLNNEIQNILADSGTSENFTSQ